MGTQKLKTKFNLGWLVKTINGCDNTAETHKQDLSNEISKKKTVPKAEGKAWRSGSRSAQQVRGISKISIWYKQSTEQRQRGVEEVKAGQS